MDGQAGTEPLALWREARQWWSGEPQCEIQVLIDERGVKRCYERELPPLGSALASGQKPLDNDQSEEWALRERKVRDPIAEKAHGRLPANWDQRKEGERAWARSRRTVSASSRATTGYVPLVVRSGYAFGSSTMLAEEIGTLAAHAGCPAACIVDPHSLVGCVEHSKACKRVGIKPLIGTSIELDTGGSVVLIAENNIGYRSLSRLITECHLGEERGYPLGSWERLERNSAGLICLTGGDLGPIDRALIRRDFERAFTIAERLISVYGRSNVFLQVDRAFLPWGISVERQLTELAEKTGLQMVAGGHITHARPDHYPAQDTLLCAQSLCHIDEVIGRKEPRAESQPKAPRFPDRSLNAERYLRTTCEMSELYADRPELLENTLRIAERCEADVLPDRMPLPQLFDDDAGALRTIVEAASFSAFRSVTKTVRKRLDHELERICRLGYASHFVVAWDMCRWAREQGVGFSGRGSVVDSAVAYCLGFSRIDANRHKLHFDRFLPEDGSKRPDIDIDFESRKRDNVRGYLVGKYGVEHVAAVCAVGAYNTRGIVREVGKVFGIPSETVSFLAKRIHGGVPPDQIEAALEGRPELRDSQIPKERFQWVIRLAGRMMDIPRNMRLHPCGVIISSKPIRDYVPLMWSAAESTEESGRDDPLVRMIQWDKRSIKSFADKYDVLCLRGQDLMAGTERRVRKANPDFSVDRLAATEDEEAYRAMRSGELVGVPQSASPAMRQAHMRLGTADLHDASLVQAGIRPGVGGAVQINELIARRRGKPFTYEHPDFESILGHTYGIIVFQEQVDMLLQHFGGYSSGEAEEIRELIHKKRKEDYGQTIKESLLARIMERGYSPVVAERVHEYVAGFKGYGFAQGHALAFAEISLRSVWLMQNHPAEYFASLLSAQPAGYYGPATIANEARIRGAQILPLDINKSGEEFEVEEIRQAGLVVPNAGIRVALTQVSGISKGLREKVVAYQSVAVESSPVRPPAALTSVGRGRIALAERDENERAQSLLPFRSVFDFAQKCKSDQSELEALILAGAFDVLHPNRRSLMWAVPEILNFARAGANDPQPTLGLDMPEPALHEVFDFCIEEKAIHERAILGLDVREHLMALEREHVRLKGGVTSDEAKRLPAGTKAFAVGNPIRLRFPPTQSGKRVVFFDLEDETGLLNVTCFDDVYQRDGKAIVTSQYVTVIGVVQDRDGSPAFLASRVFSYEPVIRRVVTQELPQVRADFLVG